MCIVVINTGADVIKILNGYKSGKFREYILPNISSNRQSDLIISLSHHLNKYSFDFIGIYCKYNYGKRNKRLEIVYYNNNKITIIKISKKRKFDKDAIELDNIITDIISRTNQTVIGLLLISDHYKKIIMNSFTVSLKNKIYIKDYKIFKEEDGILN